MKTPIALTTWAYAALHIAQCGAIDTPVSSLVSSSVETKNNNDDNKNDRDLFLFGNNNYNEKQQSCQTKLRKCQSRTTSSFPTVWVDMIHDMSLVSPCAQEMMATVQQLRNFDFAATMNGMVQEISAQQSSQDDYLLAIQIFVELAISVLKLISMDAFGDILGLVTTVFSMFGRLLPASEGGIVTSVLDMVLVVLTSIVSGAKSVVDTTVGFFEFGKVLQTTIGFLIEFVNQVTFIINSEVDNSHRKREGGNVDDKAKCAVNLSECEFIELTTTIIPHAVENCFVNPLVLMN